MPRNGAGEILVASDLGPAEVAELESGVRGIALAAGGVSAHAAIVARSLGIPMVVGVGERAARGRRPGAPSSSTARSGTVYLAPDAARVRAARARAQPSAPSAVRGRSPSRELPAVTPDGHQVRVLANVSGTAELEVALEAGAEGVGLLRTELAFLTARRLADARTNTARALAPILSLLQRAARDGSCARLRRRQDAAVLCRESRERGIELLLGHPEALAAQLRAIVATAGDAGAPRS